MKNFLLISLLSLISVACFAGQPKFPYLSQVLSSEGLTDDAFVLFAYAKGKAPALQPVSATNLRNGTKYDRTAMVAVFAPLLSPFKEKNSNLYQQLLTEKDLVTWINLVAKSLTSAQKAPMFALVQAAEKERAANVKKAITAVLKQLPKASQKKVQAMASNDSTDPVEFAGLTLAEQQVYAALRKLTL